MFGERNLPTFVAWALGEFDLEIRAVVAFQTINSAMAGSEYIGRLWPTTAQYQARALH
jgi:hypothetical protein